MAEEEKGGVPPKATPGAPRPITVRLKPVVHKTDTQRTAEAKSSNATPSAPKETVVTASSGPTARVPIPNLDDIDGLKSGATQTSATVKLRPVKVPGAKSPITSAGVKTPITPANASHKPGSNPLPPGPKPPSEAQVQAAKSKTSRISLDAAIGVAPEGPMSGGSPKTIRLKRPAKLAGTGKMPTPATGPIESQKAKTRTAPIGKTSRIPDEAIGQIDESATVTQKKTLKIKKKGAPGAETADSDSGDFDGLTPISDLDMRPVKEESPVFTMIAGIFGIAAVVAGILLFVCLGSQAIGPCPLDGNNNLATIKADVEMPWPGAVSK